MNTSNEAIRVVLGRKLESDVLFEVAMVAAEMGCADEAFRAMFDALGAREMESK